MVWAGAYTLLTVPQDTSTPDPILSVLNTTQCATTRGLAGRTLIRVAQFYWSNARISIARQLAVLKRSGCNVAVIYTNIDRAVLKVLLEAEIPVYDSLSHGTYNHSKTLIVSGRLGATDGDLVSQGSGELVLPEPGSQRRNRVPHQIQIDHRQVPGHVGPLGVVVNQDYQAAAYTDCGCPIGEGSVDCRGDGGRGVNETGLSVTLASIVLPTRSDHRRVIPPRPGVRTLR